jgi:hypothetical protein
MACAGAAAALLPLAALLLRCPPAASRCCCGFAAAASLLRRFQRKNAALVSADARWAAAAAQWDMQLPLPPAEPGLDGKAGKPKAEGGGLMPYIIINSSYLLYTVTDGAVRMIVLLHAFNLGFTAMEIAVMCALPLLPSAVPRAQRAV